VTTRIQRLDPETASRIAAGEVIERPASVVKELLDNALDAGATRIDILLVNGGRQRIQVTDNGGGMGPDDAVLALQRFTTSKMRHIEDLSHLTTLGFRGEALPSIVAVAEVEIATRTAEQPLGVLVQSTGSATPVVRPVGCPVGTRVDVQRLFAQVPVRLRALKSVAREVQQIQELVAHYALAHPHVTFHLQHEGRRVLFAAASTEMRQRLGVMFGTEVAAQMLPVQWQSLDMYIHGAISPPALHRATRQRQYVWVNGRPVRSGLVGIALERAYGARLPPGRHPLAALGIDLSPTFLDINTHPRKLEITFLHERAVFAAVQEAVERVLQDMEAVSQAWDEAGGSIAWGMLPDTQAQVGEARGPYENVPPRPESIAAIHPLGQVGSTFIVASSPHGVVLIDQHAAHESLIYERLMAAAEASGEPEETFLLPLYPAQYRWLAQLQPVLAALRLHLEPFGKETMIVRAVPAVLQPLLRPSQLLEAIQEAMQRTTPQMSPEAVREGLAAALACRTAIRAGDALTPAQITMLVEAMAHQRLPYTCPHGRPTHITLNLAEIERRFLRL
jgi:DNA mismatch repair protein MutL